VLVAAPMRPPKIERVPALIVKTFADKPLSPNHPRSAALRACQARRLALQLAAAATPRPLACWAVLPAAAARTEDWLPLKASGATRRRLLVM
jgi:hypothetical protein